MKRLLLLCLVVLSGCSGHKLAECKGPPFALNAGAWQPTIEDLKVP